MRKLQLILIIGLFGCTEMPVEEMYEISLPDSFKANVYVESVNDIEEADHYIFLHVVEADDEIDSIVRVDFNQLKQQEIPSPRKRFGIILKPDAFMFQVVETTEEFDTLQNVHEPIHSAVIEFFDYPFVHTDIGKIDYEKFMQDRAFYAPSLSAGDIFFLTKENEKLKSINY